MVKIIVAIVPALSAAVPTCSQLCADGGHGSVGFMSGTAPACGGECADCGDGHCYQVQKGDVSDYGHGCVTGSKVCCCSKSLEMEVTVNKTASKQVEDAPSDDAVPSLSLASCGAGSRQYKCCKSMCESSCKGKCQSSWCHDTGKCSWYQCHPCDSDSECTLSELEMEVTVNETASKQVEDTHATPSEVSVNATVSKQVEDALATPSDDAVPSLSLASCAGSSHTCCKNMCENSCKEKHGQWCHNTGKCTWDQCHPCDSDSCCSHSELAASAEFLV